MPLHPPTPITTYSAGSFNSFVRRAYPLPRRARIASRGGGCVYSLRAIAKLERGQAVPDTVTAGVLPRVKGLLAGLVAATVGDNGWSWDIVSF